MKKISPSSKTFPNPWLIILSLTLIFLSLAAIFIFNFTFPIETDEVAWDTINHRSIIDHYTMISLFPQCGASFGKPLPWLWFIPAWLDHIIFAPINHPLGFRILGMLRVFSWLSLWLLIFKRIFNLKPSGILLILAIIFGILAYDQVFVLMLMARPEQGLILCISIVICLSVYADHFAKRRIASILGLIIFLITTLYIGQIHPRSMAFLPLFLFTGFKFAKTILRSNIMSYSFCALISGILIYSYIIWTGRFECSQSPITQQGIATSTFPAQLIFTDPAKLLLITLKNIGATIWNDFTSASLDFNWLGSANLAISTKAFHAIAFILRFGALCIATFYTLKQLRARFRHEKITPAQIEYNNLALCLLAALIALTVFQGTRHMFYYTTINIALVIFLSILSLGNYLKDKKKHVILLVILLIGATTSICNLLIVNNNPTESVIPNLTVSFSAKDFYARQLALLSLAKECGIDQNSSNHLVLDDITYLTFKQSFQPYHIYYVTDQVANPNPGVTPPPFILKNFMHMLEQKQSSGIITDCRNLLDPMLPYAIKRDGFCCISKNTIHKIANLKH